MKKVTVILVALGLILVMTGCEMLLPMPQAQTLGAEQTLFGTVPSDEIRDVSRSLAGSFTFETLYPVEISLTIELYETDESGNLLSDDALSSAAHPAYVSLADAADNLVLAGRADESGVFETTAFLPSAPEDMTLLVRVDGFGQRSIEITDLVEYERIDRTVTFSRIGSPGFAHGSRSLFNDIGVSPADSDGDGVPDLEDVEPSNDRVAFYAFVPSRESITVAYEDLFGRANAGDADYNDFIASYTIRESINADGDVAEILVEATAVQKLAGYNHRFGIRLDSFDGTATVTGTYIASDGSVIERTPEDYDGSAEIDLFINSRRAKGKDASFTVVFDTPQTREGLDALPVAPYNPYLFVYNTGKDIHLIGREANDDSNNPGDPFVDGDLFPWALLVPRDWIHPDEGRRIENFYEGFTIWRESAGELAADWYDFYGVPYPDDPPVGNQPPYPVIGMLDDRGTPIADSDLSTPDVFDIQLSRGRNTSLTLVVDADGSGNLDPDGDPVVFASNPVLDGTGPVPYLVLATDTGGLTFSAPFVNRADVVEFWTVDDEGNLSTPVFAVRFIIGSGGGS